MTRRRSVTLSPIRVEELEPRWLMAANPVQPGFGPPQQTAYALGDVNGDGMADLVAVVNQPAQQQATISVRPGSGGGVFGPVSEQLTVPGTVTALISGQVLGNHKDCIIALVTEPSSTGTAGGNFAEILSSAVPNGSVEVALPGDVPTAHAAVADLNKDGFPDLFTWDANHIAAMAVQPTSTGTFNVTQVGQWQNPLGAGLVAIGDVNGDGMADLVGYPSRQFRPGRPIFGNIEVEAGSGGGTFQPPVAISQPDVVAALNEAGITANFTVAQGGLPSPIAVKSEGDGVKFTVSATGQEIHLGLGVDMANTPVTVQGSQGTMHWTLTIRVQRIDMAIAASDGSFQGTVSVVNPPTNGSVTASELVSGLPSPLTITVSNNGGRLQLDVTILEKPMQFSLNDPTVVQALTSAGANGGIWTQHLAVGDLNGDGVPDLAYLGPGRVAVALGAAGQAYTYNWQVVAHASANDIVLAGDVNGDGTSDVIKKRKKGGGGGGGSGGGISFVDAWDGR